MQQRIRVGYTYYIGYGNCIMGYMPYAHISDVRKAARTINNLIVGGTMHDNLEAPRSPDNHETILYYLDNTPSDIRKLLTNIQIALRADGFEIIDY